MYITKKNEFTPCIEMSIFFVCTVILPDDNFLKPNLVVLSHNLYNTCLALAFY